MPKHKEPKTPRTFDPLWIQKADNRLVVIKMARERLSDLANDLGGDLSYQETVLARRLIWLELLAETIERDVSEGKADVDIGGYVQRINAIVGVIRLLGLKRRARKVPSLAKVLQEHPEAEFHAAGDDAELETGVEN